MKSNIDKKFSAHYDAVEAELKSSTVGEQDTCTTFFQTQESLICWPWVTSLSSHVFLPHRPCDPE